MRCALFLLSSGIALAQPGTITTVAGGHPLGDGGPALLAAFTEVRAMTFDANGMPGFRRMAARHFRRDSTWKRTPARC